MRGTQSPGLGSRFFERALRPVDGASLAAFRVLFGALMFFGAVRFALSGFVEVQFVEPRYFFKYLGFEWVRVWGPAGLYLHVAAIAGCALAIAVGYRTRLAFALFTLLFVYVELMDVTNYLNHYLLVSWLGVLGVVLPFGKVASLDAGRRARRGVVDDPTVPAIALWLVRFQVGVVYAFAALAKMGSDWLLHAQPLGIWLEARSDLPVLGPLFALPAMPYLMSWGGFLYDLTIVGWLSWARSRPLAYLAVIGFHLVTSAMFPIGMFPGIMICATTIFFSPSWPRRVVGLVRLVRLVGRAPRPQPLVRDALAPWRARLLLAGVGVYIAFHLVVPLRHFAYPGEVIWNEDGMRHAWKVMVREKRGSVTFLVTPKVAPPGERRRTKQVPPSKYLTPRQEAEMAGQPDLIHQLARHIRWESIREGRGDVEVRVDAFVSLNARPPVRFLDPEVDLGSQEPSLGPTTFVLPEPENAPLRARLAKRPAP